jgi:hypothetical protein
MMLNEEPEMFWPDYYIQYIDHTVLCALTFYAWDPTTITPI